MSLKSGRVMRGYFAAVMQADHMFILGGLTSLIVPGSFMVWGNIQRTGRAWSRNRQDPAAGQLMIFEHAQTAYVLVDTDMKIVTFNHRAAAFSRITLGRELLPDACVMDYFPEKSKLPLKEMLEGAFMGAESGYEQEYRNQDGSTTWYDVKIYSAGDAGGPASAIISVRDITDKKALELQRERITEELIQHNRNLEQFAYIVSHNVRAPLANIIGISQVLRQPGIDEEEKKTFIESIFFSSNKLDEVILDLNDILQMRNCADESRQEVLLDQLLEDVRHGLKDMVPGLAITINADFSKAERLLSVKSYLYSIFYNLLSNSIKYRKPDTEPVISIESRMNNEKLEISFTDNGTGIDMVRNGDKVFGLYKRFHPDIEGKGMGLYMTRAQVEKLGGNISVNSVLNKGTEFKIQFS